jgi:hypothetical protein
MCVNHGPFRESVLFIGTQFSILYTSVTHTPPCICQPGPRPFQESAASVPRQGRLRLGSGRRGCLLRHATIDRRQDGQEYSDIWKRHSLNIKASTAGTSLTLLLEVPRQATRISSMRSYGRSMVVQPSSPRALHKTMDAYFKSEARVPWDVRPRAGGNPSAHCARCRVARRSCASVPVEGAVLTALQLVRLAAVDSEHYCRLRRDATPRTWPSRAAPH